MEDIKRIKELTALLNHHRDAYYNGSKPEISDYEYDMLYDELKSLENKTGILFNNSPTQNVGYEVKSELNEVEHGHPMLSLDKCHDESDLIKFAGDNDCVLSVKCDGLTTSLRYIDGTLVSAETRGNGITGLDVLHNVKTITNVPQNISYKGKLVIDGETIIDHKSFAEINETLSEDDKYMHPRNLASASLQLFDSEIAATRKMRFIAWKVIYGFNDIDSNFFRLKEAEKLGFDVVPMWTYTNKSSDKDNIGNMLENLKDNADDIGLPMDGAVMMIDSVSYGDSLGRTGKFPRHSIAYKFEDELFETVLEGIDWNTSKTGLINPIAKFKEVDLGGAMTTKATLHNISYIKGLQLGIGDKIIVRRANGVIPKVHDNLTRSGSFTIPDKCPICDGNTKTHNENSSETLYCANPDCKGKLLGKLTHAVSKNALNINGLSEETINTLIESELVEDIYSIYELRQSKEKLFNLERFGKKKVENLLIEIENSKDIKLSNFIYAWSIPLIGNTVSKDISKFVGGNLYEFVRIMVHDAGIPFTKIDGFGQIMYESLRNWWNEYCSDFIDLAEIMRFELPKEKSISGGTLEGKSFCITGKLTHFENRDALVADIESRGGKFVGSVNKTTDYLINNDNLSQSSKNVKAAKLGVPVITEEEYMKM